MIVVLRPGCTEAEVNEVLRALEDRGCTGRAVTTGSGTVVHLVAGRPRRARRVRRFDQVLEIVPTSGPRVRREGWRWFPFHFVNWSGFGVVLLGALVFLAGMFPTGIGDVVDYSHPPDTVAQPWYLRAPLAFVHLFPRSLFWLGWLLLMVLALIVLFLPFLDRSRLEERSGRWLRIGTALLVVSAVVLTAWQGGAP